MDKTFTFTLDDALPVNPQNKFELWRGDNVVFNFAFKSGGVDMTIPEGTKLRIFAKKVGANSLVDKTDTPLFAADFDTPTTATFNSSQTAGEAGNYLLAVMLMTADTSIITAQGIYFDLLENGYAGVYQPSPDFRDDVLDALNKALAAAAASAESATQSAESASQSATSAQSAESAKTAAQTAQTNAETAAGSAVEKATAAAQSATAAANSADQSATSAQSAEAAKTAAEEAKNQAQEIVDPDNRIGQLFQNKLNTGVLYGNEGMAKTNSAGFTTLSQVTILVRFARKNTTRTRREYICNIGDGETVNTGISVILTENNKLYLPFKLKKTDGTKLSTGIVTSDISGYLDGKMHSLAVCWAGTLAKLYIDGVLEASTSGITSGTTIVASNVNISLAGRASSNTQFFLGQISDFRVLNFDASATDAPYTVDDYQAGKRLPPALCSTTAEQRALVSLENYTIARNSTTKLIKDASGNGNDATVLGGLAGDMDAGIAAFVEELKTQINQQA